MLWMRYRMVFFSCGIYMPSDVVLRYDSILRKLLPKGSKGARWPSRFRNCCTGMYSRSVHHSDRLSYLVAVKSARPSLEPCCLLVAEFLLQNVCDNMIENTKEKKIVGYDVLQNYFQWYIDTVEYSEIVHIYIEPKKESGFFSMFKL